MKVFFDVDGVLIDGWHSDPERRKPWDLYLERDFGIDRTQFQEAFFRPSEDGSKSFMHACVKGERELTDALAEVLPALGYDGPVDDFIRYWLENDSNVNQDVLAIVKRLGETGRADLYLVTGQEHCRAAWLWDGLGFRDCFEDILYSARLGYLKSEPAFFEEINTLLAIAPGERPVFFDDQKPVVRLARAAGWDAHVFNGPDDVMRHERLQELLRD